MRWRAAPRRLARAGLLAAAWLAVAALAWAAPSGDPVLQRAARRLSRPLPRVLALYYGWYGTPQMSKAWLHYEKVDTAARTIGSHVHYPQDGPYDSADPKVLERHVRQAKAAGIDTLVCSWWGKGDQTDRSFRALLPVAARLGMTVCPLYERVPKAGEPESAKEEWEYLLDQYGPSPAWLGMDGRRFIFIYRRARSQLSAEEWADLLVAMDARPAGARSGRGVLAIADGDALEQALLFDGIFLFSRPWPDVEKARLSVGTVFRANHAALLARTKRYGRLAVVTVATGYTVAPAGPANSGGPPAGQRAQPERKDGSVYTQQWQEAARSGAAWALIDSFNQWHAGTEIEPSVELEDRYLRPTAEGARQFKQAAAGPPR